MSNEEKLPAALVERLAEEAKAELKRIERERSADVDVECEEYWNRKAGEAPVEYCKEISVESGMTGNGGV